MGKSIFLGFPHMIYGGDYNPDQWLHRPDILEEDIRLMKEAHVNEVSIGIFAWKALEPEEGVYNFEWLDQVFRRMEEAGINVILATPSGARPAWMDHAHPEAMRTDSMRFKALHGERHNHCYSSPYYRKKVREMNTMLAKRYKDSPALKMWHVSNEYGGECHCEYCQAAFRKWLEKKYGSIEELNRQWWTGFWSHGFNSFEEIESPSPRGEWELHGLNLDWARFVTYQTNDFMAEEIKPLKEITPDVPVTTNFMGIYPGLDYWRMKDTVDVISWDSYPTWHNDGETLAQTAMSNAFIHDVNRSLKHQPFLLMESTPSKVNWHKVNKLKRPGVNELVSMQAVAHGSDSVQYFQWRKGQGANEKFHGAVVDHYGKADTRVFQEVAHLGQSLEKLDEVVGSDTAVDVAVIFDWNNRLAIGNLQGLSNRRDYEGVVRDHYRALWEQGLNIDVIDEEEDFSSYKLVVAPMLYMVKPGVAERLRAFAKKGGTVVFTYLTGLVNENDLCFLGGFPGDGLMELAGVWAEEIDALYESDRNSMIGLEKEYELKDICEIIHLKGAKALANYGEDFYQGQPVLTLNEYGKGRCYYIAARPDYKFLADFYKKVVKELGVAKPEFDVPEGISVTVRESKEAKFYFIMNFAEKDVNLDLGSICGVDLISGQEYSGKTCLLKTGYLVLKVEK